MLKAIFIITLMVSVFSSLKVVAATPVTNLRVAVDHFAILNSKLHNQNIDENLKLNIERSLTSAGNFILIPIDRTLSEDNLVTPEEVVEVGRRYGTDTVITGSITSYNDDIWINFRLMETVQGSVIFSKEYFINPSEIDLITSDMVASLNNFLSEPQRETINVYDFGQGSSEIRVKSVPDKAMIALDGVEIGRAPLILRGLSPSQHILESWQEGDVDVRAFIMKSKDENPFFLEMNGEKYNNNIITLEDLSGYSFAFRAYTQEGKLQEKTRYDIKQEERTFSLELQTDPTGIEVLLDERFIGVTPLKAENVVSGEHTLSIKPQKLVVFKQIIDSYENPNAYVTFNQYKLGRVFVSSIPENAEIYVNNKLVGNTPKALDLPLGRHQILVKKEGFRNQLYSLNITEGNVTELIVEMPSLKNKETGIGFLPTAIVDNVLGTSIMAMSLGQYTFSENNKSWAYLYGGEINYGVPDIYSAGIFTFGIQAGAFFNQLGTFSTQNIMTNPGIGAKIQFLRETDIIPVSLALGGHYNFNPEARHKLSGYLAASRSFGDFSFHLGIQTQAINLNINYNKFSRIKIGIAGLLSFNLLSRKEAERITPLFGVNVGYNFF